MNWPEWVLKCVREAVDENKDDIGAATDTAVACLKSHEEFAGLVDEMVRNSVRHLVCDYRHQENVRRNREMGRYDTNVKVSTGNSESVQEAYSSLYDYYIGSRTLGSILGAELDEIAESENSKANGHRRNAVLCTALKKYVPAEKTVRECVSESRLRGLFKAAERESRK